MKTLLLVSLLLLSLTSSAQLFVRGRALSNPDSRYVFVTLTKVQDQYQAFLEADGIARNRDDKLTDSTGKVLGFAYLPGLFDYLDRSGWEYVDSMAPDVQFGTNRGVLDRSPNATFIFRRKAVLGEARR